MSRSLWFLKAAAVPVSLPAMDGQRFRMRTPRDSAGDLDVMCLRERRLSPLLEVLPLS